MEKPKQYLWETDTRCASVAKRITLAPFILINIVMLAKKKERKINKTHIAIQYNSTYMYGSAV